MKRAGIADNGRATEVREPMNIHEYQAKEVLAKFGAPVPLGYAATSVEEAVASQSRSS